MNGNKEMKHQDQRKDFEGRWVAVGEWLEVKAGCLLAYSSGI